MKESGDRNPNSPPSQPNDADHSLSKKQFLNPQSRYRGSFTPENLAFNANLQEFANRVSIICGLETNGKIAPKQAYEQIKDLWEQLDSSQNHLLHDKE
ncbi:MAG: hypothetical protein VKJ64_12070 [Leptolyngbyaceae bacterium]|nr:hypothetical protein [Leptolyngbyaceae bacterium]